MTRKERAAAVVAALARTYPSAHCELDYSAPLELLIATILSAQCTDKRVNIVTRELFRVCKSAADFVALPQEQLEKLVKTTGFFRAKAKNIKACCADLVALHRGQVPRTMEALTALAGVGRKTANVVLGNAYGMSEGVVVDTHVQRLSLRLGFTRHADPAKIEQDLMKLIPRDRWTLFSHWLIWHGRRRCFARGPDCPGCEIARLCPSAGKFGPPRKARPQTVPGPSIESSQARTAKSWKREWRSTECTEGTEKRLSPRG